MARKKPAPTKELPQSINFDAAAKTQVLAENAATLAEFAASALIAAELMGSKTLPLEHFTLSPAQREVLLTVPDISKSIQTRLTKDKASFTITEVASMTLALAEAATAGEPRQQIAGLLVANHLADQLRQGLAGLDRSKLRNVKAPKSKAERTTIVQFKITLLGSKPPIWRRIQVTNCTLDKLHEHIQTAMGWTNSHLHQFVIGGKRYGDPELLDDGCDDFECVDSTRTKLNEIVPKTGKRFSFTYGYDFGDGWEHEVLFEGFPSPEKGKQYPLCLEGARACPPEDVGGMGGFYEFLEALANPKHEQHEHFMEWSGPFDPEMFDAEESTNEMREGLPDWRE